MQDTTIIFLGAATVINSISVVVLATALKKQTDTLKKNRRQGDEHFP